MSHAARLRGSRARFRHSHRPRPMVIGVATWKLSLPGCGSLKAKRAVIRSLKDRIGNRFNVSVAETGAQDVWTRSEMTVALVAGDRRMADSVLDKIDAFVVEHGGAVVLDVDRELW